MDAGHFSFLYDGSTQTKIASDRLELLANRAAKRYLEEKADLTESIKKIAQENDLNAHQIERVCEMANIVTHRALWAKTAQKENVEFPVAKAAAIVNVTVTKPEGSAEANAPSVLTAPASSDYGQPPCVQTPGPSTVSMLGSDPAKVHNGLMGDDTKRIIIIMQKKEAEARRQKSELVAKGIELEDLEKAAFRAVKQEVLSNGTSFKDLYIAAAACELGKVAAEYFPKWEERLIGETHGETRLRLEKLAIGKVPEELISTEMGNTAIANGAHPVLVSLDTVRRKTGEIKNGLSSLLRINDELDMFTQRIKELS